MTYEVINRIRQLSQKKIKPQCIDPAKLNAFAGEILHSIHAPPGIGQRISQQAGVAVVVFALEFLARFQNDVFASAILGQPQRTGFTDDFLGSRLGNGSNLAAFQQPAGGLELDNWLCCHARCQRAADHPGQAVQGALRGGGFIASGAARKMFE